MLVFCFADADDAALFGRMASNYAKDPMLDQRKIARKADKLAQRYSADADKQEQQHGTPFLANDR